MKREIFRSLNGSLTIRIPLLAISVTCGCALNFGQVKVDGTLNATADTEIDTKIDTTVNASASVAQTGGEQQVVTSTPTPTATPGPRGTITIFKDQRLGGETHVCCGGEGYWNNNQEMLIVNLIASKDRQQTINLFRLTINNKLQIVNMRIYVNNDPLTLVIPTTPSGIAELKKKGGLFHIDAGGSAKVTMTTGWSANGDPLLYSELFRGKTTYVSINEVFDIETESGAEIIGLPIRGPETKFGNCLPDDPEYKKTPC